MVKKHLNFYVGNQNQALYIYVSRLECLQPAEEYAMLSFYDGTKYFFYFLKYLENDDYLV
jgi:hypothetical protein